jgi:hypothetical protein
MYMTLSIYDIVHEYLSLFKKKATKEFRRTVKNDIKELLANGWCADEIIKVIQQKHRSKPDVNNMYPSFWFATKRPKKRNLLTPGKFYYHNDLRLTSPPPKRELDYDTGEIKIVSNVPYFLEMKASYTIDDLIRYYAKQFRIKITKEDWSRYQGSFNWLLKNYKLETILFMIDATVNHCEAEDLPVPSTPLEIRNYYREALEAKNAKKTEAVLSGGNKIVRKKRMQPS